MNNRVLILVISFASGLLYHAIVLNHFRTNTLSGMIMAAKASFFTHYFNSLVALEGPMIGGANLIIGGCGGAILGLIVVTLRHRGQN